MVAYTLCKYVRFKKKKKKKINLNPEDPKKKITYCYLPYMLP